VSERVIEVEVLNHYHDRISYITFIYPDTVATHNTIMQEFLLKPEDDEEEEAIFKVEKSIVIEPE